MKKIITIITGTVILSIWNAISWMVLPYHGEMLNTIPDSTIEKILGDGLPSGTNMYHYPGLSDPNLTSKLENGPRIPFLMYVAEGSSVYDPATFLKSIAFNLLCTIILFLILAKLKNLRLKNVLLTSFLCGLLVAFASDFPQTVWYMFPNEYAIVNMIDHLVRFVCAGLIIYFFQFKRQIQAANEG